MRAGEGKLRACAPDESALAFVHNIVGLLHQSL